MDFNFSSGCTRLYCMFVWRCTYILLSLVWKCFIYFFCPFRVFKTGLLYYCRISRKSTKSAHPTVITGRLLKNYPQKIGVEEYDLGHPPPPSRAESYQSSSSLLILLVRLTSQQKGSGEGRDEGWLQQNQWFQSYGLNRNSQYS